MGASDKNPSVEDIIAAKLKARAEEAAREAAEEARGGGGRSGGVDFTGASGIHIGGGAAGRDLYGGNVTTTTTNASGMTAEDFAKAFDSIYQKIAAKPKEDQPDIKEAVDTIKQAAEKEAAGEKPDAATEKEVKSASQAIVAASPDLIDDVLEVATATLANPAAGVALIVRKVLEKARAMRGGATA